MLLSAESQGSYKGRQLVRARGMCGIFLSFAEGRCSGWSLEARFEKERKEEEEEEGPSAGSRAGSEPGSRTFLGKRRAGRPAGPGAEAAAWMGY